MESWLALAVAAIGVILVPTLAMLLRITIKWTQIQDQLQSLMVDKDKVHLAIVEELRTDRRNNDRRLRWLEENLWKRGNNAI